MVTVTMLAAISLGAQQAGEAIPVKTNVTTDTVLQKKATEWTASLQLLII